jgi:hypothetical protein
MGRKKAPIEQIFREIVKRKMTPKERRILLGEPKKPRNSKKSGRKFGPVQLLH